MFGLRNPFTLKNPFGASFRTCGKVPRGYLTLPHVGITKEGKPDKRTFTEELGGRTVVQQGAAEVRRKK